MLLIISQDSNSVIFSRNLGLNNCNINFRIKTLRNPVLWEAEARRLL